MDRLPDELLVDRCLEGDRQSFELLVERYQTLVCSIAYSITGDFARSEDVGQESLVEAWSRLDRLHDKSKFKSWLCSIVRHTALNSNRRLAKTDGGEYSESIPDPADSAEQRAIRDEEAHLVWMKLQELPESYREPLILFYRQEQSISQVAKSLDLSSDVVKQRLSRGRSMLRDEVAATIQRALRGTVPSRAFTVAVLAATGTIGSQTATAATAATAATTVAKQAVGSGAVKSASLAGATAGPLVGLGGAFFGAWCSWMTARYESQRQLIVRSCIIYVVGATLFSVPFVAMRFGWQPWRVYGQGTYTVMHLSWMGVFMLANFAWMFAVFRAHQKLVNREARNQTVPLPAGRSFRPVGTVELQADTQSVVRITNAIPNAARERRARSGPRPRSRRARRGRDRARRSAARPR